MILRRFIEHLKSENWFAVGLEFAVVVAGIFVGMQATDWNEERKARAEEKAYLTRIYSDQKASLEALRDSIGASENRAAGTRSLAEWLSGQGAQPGTAEEMQWILCRWFVDPAPEIQNHAFAELMSAGQLKLLRDSELRLLLQKVERAYEAAATDGNTLAAIVADKARGLESFVFWEVDPGVDAVASTERGSGARCRVDFDGLRASAQAQSVIVQLYRSQLIFGQYKAEQAAVVQAVIDYMDAHHLAGD